MFSPCNLVIDHVIYGTLLECNHMENALAKKSKQTTLDLSKPQMRFNSQVWADPGAEDYAMHHAEGNFLLI